MWPGSSSVILMYTTLRAIMYRPANSALVADGITFFMICVMFSIFPLFGGTVVTHERKKCPPTWLCAFGLLK